MALHAGNRRRSQFGPRRFFGMSLSIASAANLVGIAIPTDFVFMLPFISVIVVLIIFAREARLPAALALPYHRGSR